MAKTVGIYLRGEDPGGEALCREYASLYYGAGEAALTLFRDEADRSAEQLPGFEALAAQAEAGSLAAVLVPGLAALCRGAADYLEQSRRFGQLGVPLVFVRERLDSASATGRTVQYAAELFLQLEKQAAAASIRDHMLRLARTGHWLGGVTPTGYRSRPAEPVLLDGKRHRAFELELVPEQADTVRAIYGGFLELDSLTRLAERLEAQGRRTKNGRAFSRFTLRQILENPVYMRADAAAYAHFAARGAQVCSPERAFDGARGLMVYNKTAQQPGAGGQRPVGDWIVAVGTHQGLVSGADWLRVQERLAANKPHTARKPKSGQGLLAGLLRCADCGSAMRPKLTRRPDEEGAEGERVFSYMCECKERTRMSECDLPNLPGGRADRAVRSLLRVLDPDAEGVLPAAEATAAEQGLREHDARIAALQAELDGVERTISELVFSLVRAIDKSAYDYIVREIDRLHLQAAGLREQLEGFAALPAAPAGAAPREGALEMLELLRAALPAPLVQQRAALRALLAELTWDGRILTVQMAGGARFELAIA